MKNIPSNKGVIPIIVIVAISALAIGGTAGGIIGFLLGGGAGWFKGVVWGVGIGVILAIFVFPNSPKLIQWFKKNINEIKK
jgi:hypothetical protein